MFKKTLLILIAGTLVLSFSSVAFAGLTAEDTNPPAGLRLDGTNGLDQPNDVFKIFNTLIDWMFTILLVVAVLLILIAAFRYLTAGGSEENIKTAHNTLLWAVVAIAVALLASGVTSLVRSLVSSDGASSSAPAPIPNTGGGGQIDQNN